MDTSIGVGIVNNIALLLAMGLLYDILEKNAPAPGRRWRQAAVGLVIGGMGVVLMASPVKFHPGVVFDARSVLLGISGLFFGPWATLPAMAVTAAYRLLMGGMGEWFGVALILTSGGIGMAWRHYRRHRLAALSLMELYLFGLAIHGCMLALILSLPRPTAFRAMIDMGPIVITAMPAATALLGKLMANHLARQAMAAELRAGAERFRNLFNNTLNPILLIDGDGRFLDANPAGLAFLECDLPTLRRLSTREFVPPGATPIPALAPPLPDRPALAEADCWVNERLKTLLLNVVPPRPGGRGIWHAIGQDITERKRLERELRLNEARLEIIRKIAGMRDADEKQISDYTLERMIHLCRSPIGFLGFLTPDEGTMVIHAWSQASMAACAIQNKPIAFPIDQAGLWGEPVRRRRPMIFNDYAAGHPAKKGCPEGHVEISRFAAIPVWDGDRIVAVAAVANKTLPYNESDIGQLDLLMRGMWEQIRRKRGEQRVLESEARWRSLAESSPDIILMLNRDLKIEFTNMAFPGFAVDDLIGADFIQHMPEARRRSILDLLKGVLATGAPAAYETEIQPPDGETRHFENRVVARRAGEMLVGLTLSARDVTDKKRAEVERAAMDTRLQQAQKMEAMAVLAGGIAHDFNNILFPIVGLSEMLAEDLPPGAQREKASQIHLAAMRAGDLVRQILGFSRQTEGRRMPTRIQPVVKEVLKLARATLPSNIVIRDDIRPDCAKVLADPTKLHQIIMNLITNAYHALEDDGGEIAVSLEQTPFGNRPLPGLPPAPAGYARLQVSDTGHGIPEAILSKVCEPYFTTKPQGKGTGLGLAVVHGIVRDYGGDMAIRSAPGQGANFSVYLPIIAGPTIPAAPAEAAADPALRGGGEHLLIVDDEERVLLMERMMAERLGYRITVSANADEALRAFEAAPESFDMVITDMTMPGLSGLQLAERLRRIRPALPIVLCTGYHARLDRDRIVAAGIDGFLNKPVTKAEFARTIRAALDADGSGRAGGSDGSGGAGGAGGAS